jgi:hypothetical protein
MQDNSELFKEVFSQFMNPGESLIFKAKLPDFVATFEVRSGRKMENAMELLMSVCILYISYIFLDPDQLSFTCDQLMELLCPHLQDSAKIDMLKFAEPDKDEFKEELQNTIATYERLFALQKSQNKDTSQTVVLLSSLRGQLKSYMSQSANNLQGDKGRGISVLLPKKKLTMDEMKRKALEEIFRYYAKQCGNSHGKKTFEAMEDNQLHLLFGYFTKLLKDFEIAIEPNV